MNPASFILKHRIKFLLGGLAILATLAVASPLLGNLHAGGTAGNTHSAHSDHSGHTAHGGDVAPREAGQSAFAAIAEIVALLYADPDTDWSKVDIGSLRAHLLDMDRLMLGASASQQTSGDTVTFLISGEGDVLRAIHAMVPAHARELDRIDNWRVSTQTTPQGAVLKVSTETPKEIERIKGLGFFGLMATGSHHQPHHMAMAKGELMGH